MTISQTFFNDRTATVEDLSPLAFAGYAHFTAMQIRDHAVKGLDLHLKRLRDASTQLFGTHLPDEQILRYLQNAATQGPADASLMCFITSEPGEFMPAPKPLDLNVLIKLMPAAEPPAGPLALDLVDHQRDLPTVKHVGEVAKTHYLRKANAKGFDDAAFRDNSGRISEATIWNLAFWDGESVIWPQAGILPGVTMQILSRQLEALQIPQRTVPVTEDMLTDELSAVVMNSWTPGIDVARIGEHGLASSSRFVEVLHGAYANDVGTALLR